MATIKYNESSRVEVSTTIEALDLICDSILQRSKSASFIRLEKKNLELLEQLNMLEMHVESLTVDLIEAEKNLSRELAHKQQKFKTLKQQMEKLALDLVSDVQKLNGSQVSGDEAAAQAEAHIYNHYDASAYTYSALEYMDDTTTQSRGEFTCTIINSHAITLSMQLYMFIECTPEKGRLCDKAHTEVIT